MVEIGDLMPETIQQKYTALKERTVRSERLESKVVLGFIIVAMYAMIIIISSAAAFGQMFFLASKLDAPTTFTPEMTRLIWAAVVASSVFTSVLSVGVLIAGDYLEKQIKKTTDERIKKL